VSLASRIRRVARLNTPLGATKQPYTTRAARHPYIEEMAIAGDPIARYLRAFDQLRADKHWSHNIATFRFVALTLGAVGPAISYDRLNQAAEELRTGAHWASPLHQEIRFVVAAMLLRRQLDPAGIQARVTETLDGFKARKLPKLGIGPTLGALLLTLHSDGRPVAEQDLQRLARIFRQWRKDHFWLTDANDLPAAALHASRREPVETLTANMERAYDNLRNAGFRRGNPLQLASHLLAAHPQGIDTGVSRFCVIAEQLKSAGESVSTGRYDEIAMLALTQGAPQTAVDRVLRYCERLRQAKPRPSKEVAFSLAAGIELAEDTERATKENAGDLTALQSIRAILDAQHAAVMVAVSAGTGAAVAASN